MKKSKLIEKKKEEKVEEVIHSTAPPRPPTVVPLHPYSSHRYVDSSSRVSRASSSAAESKGTAHTSQVIQEAALIQIQHL